jgi:uncharacterized protein
MRYNMAQLLMEPTGSTRSFQLDESLDGSFLAEERGDPERGQVRAHGAVQVLRTHHGVLVKAALQTELYMTCSRCLKDFHHGSQLEIEEEAFPLLDPATGKPEEAVEDQEDAIPIDSQHMLDLSDVVRQYLLTDIPIKPLCQENCLGLCPDCGADLNKEKCNCDAAPVDPRWGALAGLRANGRE